MHTSLLKQIDDAIRQTVDWQGFTLDSIDVSPDTYIAICDYYFAVNHGMSWMPERYKGNKINIVQDLRTPFHINARPKVKISVWNDPSAPSMSFDKPHFKYRPNSIIIDDINPK